ncbi:MAG: histone deacetylase [Cyanobacteria bacterium]|nr:histone deacetylase [Cyanobacteriota bacterium]
MAATCSIFYSDAFLGHKTGGFHPENPGRLTAVVAALKAAPFGEQLCWRSPPAVADRDPLPAIREVHNLHYLSDLEHLADTGGGLLDPDTPVSPRSYAVALLAVNGWLAAVDAVLQTAAPAFVLARPPGHHAISDRGMGFCLLANAAIAAHYAVQQPGISRVAVVDWDVHHGNGTQALVENHPEIAYCSLHQFPAYPGTGRADDHGPHGTVLNLPMAPGSALADYEAQFQRAVLPFLRDFGPDLIIVSAGYDANRADPLASINLDASDYGVMTHHCLSVQPRILFGLEGGYDHQALAESVVATVAACLD